MGLLDQLLAAYAAPPPSEDDAINIRGIPMRPQTAAQAFPGVGGLLDSFMAMRARNAARPLGPTMQATTFDLRPDSMVPGGAMDQQAAAAAGLPLAVEAFAPKMPPVPGADVDLAMGAAMQSPAAPRPNASGDDKEQPGPMQPDGETGPPVKDTDFSSGGMRAPVGPPMSLAPPMPQQPPQPQMRPPMPGMDAPKTQDEISAAMLLALAGGFAGAGSIGTGMRRAFSNAAPVAMAEEGKKTKLAEAQTTFRDLVAMGVPPQLAMSAVRNPAIMKEVAERFGTPKNARAPQFQTIHTKEGDVLKRVDPDTGALLDIPGVVPNLGDKRKNLSVADADKLSDEAAKLNAVSRYAAGFKPEFAGDVSETFADAKNWIGDKLPPSIAGKTNVERARWWRDYAAFRNDVRHGLYGASLTKSETENFLKQDITPGMDPEAIKTVLQRQQKIIQDAMKRKGSALIAGGHVPAAIAAAYGVEPSFFGAGDDDEESPKAKPAGRSVTVNGKKVEYRILP